MKNPPPNPTPPPHPDEFAAGHLRPWLAERERMEETVLRWVVCTARRLEGLPADKWEWVVTTQPKEFHDDPTPPAG